MSKTRQITMCKSKIHRATVTSSNLDYIGSITIDETLMNMTGLYEFEQVHIVNNNTGDRFITYVIKGERNSGVICLNGAASRLVQVNDVIIIISYCLLDESEAAMHKPRIAHLDRKNRIISEQDAIKKILVEQKADESIYLSSVVSCE